MKKVRVFHFHNGSGGGVLSVIRNLLRFSSGSRIESHVIHTINKDAMPGDYIAPGLEGAVSEQVFYYSATWNFYHTCHRLAALLPDEEAVIVAHDWLELGMASCLGLKNPLVQFLHGDFPYYYQLAERHQGSVDIYMGVSRIIVEQLQKLLPERKDAILYRRFPVPEVKTGDLPRQDIRILYLVRDITDARKNFALIPRINELLQRKGIGAKWTIVGQGMTQDVFRGVWGGATNYTYFPGISNERVMQLLSSHRIFVLPSLHEGFPVAVVEAMKAGCVPLVTDWDGATGELVMEGISGYYLRPDDAEGYASRIATLYSDKQLLERLAVNALEKANALFDPYRNTLEIEEAIMRSCQEKRSKHPEKTYGSRLDQPWLPNVVTQTIRRLNTLK